jgi:hypothetical protein
VTFYQDSQFGVDFSGQKIDYDLNFSFAGLDSANVPANIDQLQLCFLCERAFTWSLNLILSIFFQPF